MIGVFISSFTFWAVIYYVIWHWEPKCFLGFHSFLSAFLFSIETQNTIGETHSTVCETQTQSSRHTTQ
jgi:hypothetical protein